MYVIGRPSCYNLWGWQLIEGTFQIFIELNNRWVFLAERQMPFVTCSIYYESLLKKATPLAGTSVLWKFTHRFKSRMFIKMNHSVLSRESWHPSIDPNTNVFDSTLGFVTNIAFNIFKMPISRNFLSAHCKNGSRLILAYFPMTCEKCRHSNFPSVLLSVDLIGWLYSQPERRKISPVWSCVSPNPLNLHVHWCPYIFRILFWLFAFFSI